MQLKKILTVCAVALGSVTAVSAAASAHMPQAQGNEPECYTEEEVQAKFIKGWYLEDDVWVQGDADVWYPYEAALWGSGSGTINAGMYGLPGPDEGGQEYYEYKYDTHILQKPSDDCDPPVCEWDDQLPPGEECDDVCTPGHPDYGSDCDPCDDIGDYGPDCDPCDDIGDLGDDCDETTTTTSSTTTTTTTTAPPTDSTTTTTLPAGSTTTSTTTTTTTPGGEGTTTSTSVVSQLPPDTPSTTLLVVPTSAAGPVLAPQLPATGSQDTTGQIAMVALLLLGAGGSIVWVTRRRRPDMI
ncbi:MAG TPA: LPXTG cell wall anchor domain-containing protein [Ilumatobacter sp.]|nr:LPXTG cell wall anchor domain-containing protein [Ilumatobacter sp.]